MPASFPNHEPTSRTYRTGKWPTTTATSQSGVVTRRLWANKASGATLNLTYENITDAEADDFMATFDATKGNFDYFSNISSSHAVFAGMSASLVTEILDETVNAGAQWTFRNRPNIQSVIPGISTVTVNLIAELRLA